MEEKINKLVENHYLMIIIVDIYLVKIIFYQID
jgi:hypothetical protein